MERPQKAELSILEQISMKVSEKSFLSGVNRIFVLSPMTKPLEVVETREDMSDNPLVIRMDSPSLCHGEDLVISYRVNTDMKFKELLVELEYLEHWKGNDWLRKEISNTYSRKLKKIPGDRVIRNEWSEITIQHPAIAPKFSRDLLEISPSLKVSIVRRYRQGHITARIPLNVGDCLTPDWRKKAEEEFKQRWEAEIEFKRRWDAEKALKRQGRPIPKLKGRVVKPTPPEEQIPEEERMAQNWCYRAVRYRDSGEIDEAIRSIEKALEWQPDSEQALTLRDELKKLENKSGD